MAPELPLSQTQRIVVFGLNCLCFYLVYVLLNETWRISAGPDALWLFSAFAWWVLSLVSAPWFRPPRDVIGAATAAFLSLIVVQIPDSSPNAEVLVGLRYFTLGYAIFVATAAIVAAATLGSSKTLSARAFFIAQRLSSGEFLFGLVAFISIFGFYTNESSRLVLVILWLAFAAIRPFELLFGLWRDLSHEKKVELVCGEIVRFDNPNIVRVQIYSNEQWKDDCYSVCLPDGTARYVIPIGTQLQGDAVIGTGLITEKVAPSGGASLHGKVLRSGMPVVPRAELLAALPGAFQDDALIGQVVEHSDIGSLEFELLASAEIVEGSLVAAQVRTQRVFYQVMEGITYEESLLAHPRGMQRVTAAQLGSWTSEGGFKKVGWLPEMNAPVFLVSPDTGLATDLTEDRFAIGNIPNTDLRVAGEIDEMIEFHTAVLGITGTGKTEVALDLVREAHAKDAKVFCVDLTGEYRQRLADLDPIQIGLSPEQAEELESKLFDVETGKYGAPDEKKVLKECVDGLRTAARDGITTFLQAPGGAVAVFELAEVTNTKATLRITELFISQIMLWARSHRRARKIMIVLEEAHTIIPETMGAGFDYDTQWVVGRIGQIALQGRKYGVGLLVVSQRTALVSKTILSQCNTFLVHSLVDQTSLNFLGNVFQDEHVRAIPNLRFRQMLAYGKGVVSERPVLIERPFDQTKADASAALNVAAEEVGAVAVDIEDLLGEANEPGGPAPPNPFGG